jgi:gliding motility-associated lipoprotein GldH
VIDQFLKLSIACSLLLLLGACNEGTVYEKNLKIPGANWNRQEKAVFEFDIEDTAAVYSFFLNFRHAGDYPYKNIYLFSETKSPSGKLAIDTAQMLLADNKGRWMGKGIGDIYDYRFKFKEGQLFPEAGTYVVELEQAMRVKELVNVTDIGISIDKTTE